MCLICTFSRLMEKIYARLSFSSVCPTVWWILSYTALFTCGDPDQEPAAVAQWHLSKLQYSCYQLYFNEQSVVILTSVAMARHGAVQQLTPVSAAVIHMVHTCWWELIVDQSLSRQLTKKVRPSSLLTVQLLQSYELRCPKMKWANCWSQPLLIKPNCPPSFLDMGYLPRELD